MDIRGKRLAVIGSAGLMGSHTVDRRAAFARTADGPDCPVARVYRPAGFVAPAARTLRTVCALPPDAAEIRSTERLLL